MFSRLISYLSIALCSFYLVACSGPETAQDVSVTFVRSAYTADVKKTLDCIDFLQLIKKMSKILNLRNLLKESYLKYFLRNRKKLRKKLVVLRKFRLLNQYLIRI